MVFDKCCTTGFKHEGESTGEIKQVEDVDVYFAYPESISTDKAIVFMTDVFGIPLINNRLLADQFASCGYFVAMPDLFDKDPVPFPRPDGFDMLTWFQKHTFETAASITQKVIKHLQSNFGVKRIGSVGYCYGAKVVVMNMQPESNFIDVGYAAHPSRLAPADYTKIQGPMSISAAYYDKMMEAEQRHQTELELLKTKQPFEITVYNDVEHGFAVRSDLSVKSNKHAKEGAFLQAARWFDTHL